MVIAEAIVTVNEVDKARDGDVHVLLNGEIYNWRSFGARSEAGAVLQAYRRLGGAAIIAPA